PIYVGSLRPGQILIPPGVAHGYKVIGGKPGMLIYMTDRFYDPSDEGRIAYDHPGINYDWETQHKYAMKLLVTGGAGFIGSAFVRLSLSDPNIRIVNLDKLTYAGNLANLEPIAGNSRYRFAHGDICDAA